MLSRCFGVLADVFFVVLLVLFLLSFRVVSADLSLFDFLSILILNNKEKLLFVSVKVAWMICKGLG